MHFDSVLGVMKVERGEDEEGGGDAEETEGKRENPSSFDMTENNLTQTQILWPFILLASAYLGVLNNPQYASATIKIAVSGLGRFCKSIQFEEVSHNISSNTSPNPNLT